MNKSKLSQPRGGNEVRSNSHLSKRVPLPLPAPRDPELLRARNKLIAGYKKKISWKAGNLPHQRVRVERSSNVCNNFFTTSQAEMDLSFPALPRISRGSSRLRKKTAPSLDASYGGLNSEQMKDLELVSSGLQTLNDILEDEDNVVSPFVKEFRTILQKAGDLSKGMKSMKELSSQHRSNWILNGGSDKGAQCSFLGRALPTGSDEQVKAAILTHKLDYESEHTTHEYYIAQARLFSRRWAKRHCSSADFIQSPDLPTLSSCMEATVKQGGLRSVWQRDDGSEIRAQGISQDRRLWSKYDNLSGSTLQYLSSGGIKRDQSMRIDLVTMEKGLESIKEHNGLYQSKVLCLKERGLKTRVITKSPAGLHFLGHVVRKRLVSGLKKTKASQSTLIGFDDTKVGDFFKDCVGEVCVSTDLTRASDLLPLDLVSAIIDGLEESGKFTQPEIISLRRMNGPQELIYPDGSQIESKRGILMGLPTTWTLLSLIHMFWWDLAISQTDEEASIMAGLEVDDKGTNRRDYYKLHFPKLTRDSEVAKDTFERSRRRRKHNKFMICGDDGLFVGTREVSDRYLRIMQDCGGIPSPGKHYVSRPLIDVNKRIFTRGVFLERLFQFQINDLGRVQSAVRSSAIPIRGLVRPDSPSDFRGDGVVRISEGIKHLYSVDQIVENHSRSTLTPIKNWCRRRPALYRIAKDNSLPIGVPISLGGSGLPYLGSNLDYGSHIRDMKRKANFAIQTGVTKFSSFIRGVLDPNWARATRMVEKQMKLFDQHTVQLEREIIPNINQSLIDRWNDEMSNQGYALGRNGYYFIGTYNEVKLSMVVKTFKSLCFDAPKRSAGKVRYLNDKVFANTSRDFWKQVSELVVPMEYTEGSYDRPVYGTRQAAKVDNLDFYVMKKGSAAQRAILFDMLTRQHSLLNDSENNTPATGLGVGY